MPVDLEFQTTHTLTAETDGVEIRLPVSFLTTVRNDRNQANINVTPDTTDPLDELFRNFVSEGAIDFVVLFLPYGRQGTMTVEGTGTVFRTDTGAYDTINSGSALLTYDTRQPELIFSDLPTRYEPGDSASADFIVGFNRNVTFDVTDPSNADEVFAFDGPYFGSVPGLYRYTGSGQPRLPLPANLMTAIEWALMHVNDSAQYFAVRFSQVPDTAQGTLNITLRADVALTPDNENSLLAVTLPPPVPAPQTQSIPIIENISTQFLDLTEDFNVAINITGGQANKAYVKGLALGSYAKFDETNQRINIIGNANKLITDSMWRCFASGPGGDATPVNQIFNYVQVAPVVTSRSRQDVFIGIPNEILIPISNNPSDGTVTTELIGLEHKLVDNVGNGMNTHMRIYGTPPAGVNFGIDEGSFSILGTNTGGDHTAMTEWRKQTTLTVYAVASALTLEKCYVITLDLENDTATIARSFNLTAATNNVAGLSRQNGMLYTVDSHNDNVIVFPDSIVDGSVVQVSQQRTISLPALNNDPASIIVDGTDIYVLDTTVEAFFVFPENTPDLTTPVATRGIIPPLGTDVTQASAIKGGDIFALNSMGSPDSIIVMSKNTPLGGDNSKSVVTGSFNLTSNATSHGMAIIGDVLLLVRHQSNTNYIDIIDISASLSSGDVVVISTFTTTIPDIVFGIAV